MSTEHCLLIIEPKDYDRWLTPYVKEKPHSVPMELVRTYLVDGTHCRRGFIAFAQKVSAFNQPSGCAFVSLKAKEKVPVWPSALMSDYILPAVKAAGIDKHV